MDVPAGTAPPPAMRSPERWLTVLRIALGVWFGTAIFTKLSVTLVWGFLPVPTVSDRWLHVMPLLVTKYAEGTGRKTQTSVTLSLVKMAFPNQIGRAHV